MQERSVPQNIQQLVIRDYCKRNGLEFLLSTTEYGNGYIMLNSLVDNKSIEGLVMYSIWQLPGDKLERINIIFNGMLLPGKIHFAAENIRMVNMDNVQMLEDIWLLKRLTS
jgi:sporadic carbohydrate cluster protein (TIGR04323 family)